eukprot:469813-Prorocentrum_minimum.AAC.1
MVHTTRTKEEQACSRSLTLRARPRSYTQSGAASVSHSERNRVGLALGAYSRRSVTRAQLTVESRTWSITSRN